MDGCSVAVVTYIADGDLFEIGRSTDSIPKKRTTSISPNFQRWLVLGDWGVIQFIPSSKDLVYRFKKGCFWMLLE